MIYFVAVFFTRAVFEQNDKVHVQLRVTDRHNPELN
jgi:hypothetical protein